MDLQISIFYITSLLKASDKDTLSHEAFIDEKGAKTMGEVPG